VRAAALGAAAQTRDLDQQALQKIPHLQRIIEDAA
jgi:hypothetical protein